MADIDNNAGLTPEEQYIQERSDRMNISSIETFFDSLLRGTLTDNLFFNELPPSIKDTWNDMAVVDCGNPLSDNTAYATSTVLIALYARQNPYGYKDVKTLQSLEKKLNRIIETCNDEHYHISRRGNYSNYNAINDIYFNVVQITVIIS